MAEISTNEVIMPWEHYVCSECYQENPYAIWLVKQRCFKPQWHHYDNQTLITVDKESTAMVHIRPLPDNYDRIRGNFILCRYFRQRRACPNSSMCRFAHSEIEKDTWNIKKRMLMGKINILKGNRTKMSNSFCFPFQCSQRMMICDHYRTSLEQTSHAILPLKYARSAVKSITMPSGWRGYCVFIQKNTRAASDVIQ